MRGILEEIDECERLLWQTAQSEIVEHTCVQRLELPSKKQYDIAEIFDDSLMEPCLPFLLPVLSRLRTWPCWKWLPSEQGDPAVSKNCPDLYPAFFKIWPKSVQIGRRPHVEFIRLTSTFQTNKIYKIVSVHYHLDLAKNLTPSPSGIAIIWERPVFPSIAMALRRSEMGMFVNGDSSGGSVIS